MRDYDATIFTIATGKYLDYFALQLPQIAKHYAPGKTVQIIVATDRKNFRPLPEDTRLSVEYVGSPSYTWPEITLLRYEQILANRKLIRGRTLMWLDTDMEFLNDVNHELIVGSGDSINYALHPGFVWSSSKANWLNPFELMRQSAPWFLAWLKGQKGPGTWETNKTSQAFVPVRKRMNYAHGAVWGGLTEHVMELVEVLATRTRDDYERGIVAVWHDESHLNWYVANRNAKPFPLGFSAWKKAWQFDESSSFFNSLDKSELDAQLRELES